MATDIEGAVAMESRMPDRLPFYRLAVFPLLLAQLIVLLMAALVLWQWQGVVAGYSGQIGRAHV